MKKNKKATIYESLQGLIIFAIILIAIILMFRGCAGNKRLQDNSLKDIKEAIEEMRDSSTDGEKLVQVYMPEESMIIGYYPNNDAIYTGAITKIHKLKTPASDLIGDKVEQTPLVTGELIYRVGKNAESTVGTNFYGYVKERANNCPLNSFCICECWPFSLETKTGEGQKFTSANAHITCQKETCQIIDDLNLHFHSTSHEDSEIKLTTGIKPLDFFKQTSTYEHLPELENIYWQGGFIVVRTKNEYLEKKPIRHCFIKYEKSGTTLERFELTDLTKCANKWNETTKTGLWYDETTNIAGNIRSMPSDFFDLTIKKTSGKISFEAG